MARTDPRPHYGAKRRIAKNGYVYIWEPDHPLTHADGYVAEHRKVAWDAGIVTEPTQHVHHLNGNRLDNGVTNLIALTNADHAMGHARERGTITNQFGTFPILDHGPGAYMRGCRCDVCRAANTERCRLYRARRIASE